MFIQEALTFTFRRNQVQTLALRPAWMMTFTVYLGSSMQTSQQYLQWDQNHLLPLVFEFIIYQSSYHSLPYWLLTAWSSKDEINLSLPTQPRHIEREEVQLHAFLTLALQGGKPQPHAWPTYCPLQRCCIKYKSCELKRGRMLNVIFTHCRSSSTLRLTRNSPQST